MGVQNTPTDGKSHTTMKTNTRLMDAAPMMLDTISECLDIYKNKEQNAPPLAIYEKCLLLLLESTYKQATGYKYESKISKSTI